MSSFIVLRRRKNEDVLKLQELTKNYVMSFAWKTFISCVFKEITVQIIVILWAILFIFFGVPLIYGTLSIPFCLLSILVSTYTSCYVKATEYSQINYKDCWVAEAFEPLLNFNNPKERAYCIYYDHSPYDAVYENKYKKSIIGAIGLDKHNSLYNSGWITGLIVNNKYEFYIVAEPLVKLILKYCCDHTYSSVELVTNMWQEDERDAYYKMGFNTRQIYHKAIAGTGLSIQKCQLGINLTDWQNSGVQ